MSALWHPVDHGAELASAMEAELHSRVLRIEHRAGEPGWRWYVLSAHRHELAAGVASGARGAERAAEDEAYRIHPPVGDMIAWWRDR